MATNKQQKSNPMNPSDDGLDELLGATASGTGMGTDGTPEKAKEDEGQSIQDKMDAQLEQAFQFEALKKQSAELQAKLEASEQARKVAEAKAVGQTKKEDVEEKYLPQANERGLYHVVMAKRAFHPVTRVRLEVPFVQKFSPAEYRVVSANLAQLGYDDINILWDPNVNA